MKPLPDQWVSPQRDRIERCDQITLTRISGNSWKWVEYNPKGESGTWPFGSSAAAIRFVDGRVPLRQCLCPPDKVLTREIEEALERKRKQIVLPKTPELDKLHYREAERAHITHFLLWLISNKMINLHESKVAALLAEYFGLNPTKLEEERRALLEYQRALNGDDS